MDHFEHRIFPINYELFICMQDRAHTSIDFFSPLEINPEVSQVQLFQT